MILMNGFRWAVWGNHQFTNSPTHSFSIENGYLSVELLKKDPIWDPLREVAAFRELIENPEYQISL
jgi:hypothetical protein